MPSLASVVCTGAMALASGFGLRRLILSTTSREAVVQEDPDYPGYFMGAIPNTLPSCPDTADELLAMIPTTKDRT